MKIGFDAKRAFNNHSGLGNYSRNNILYLNKFFPEFAYYLFSPKTNNAINFIESQNVHHVSPQNFFDKKFNSYWRTFKLAKIVELLDIDIFHGLSNEIPVLPKSRKTKYIVTIHDLIFLRYPQLYKLIDRKIYNKKFRYSCEKADKIIAISKQTKQDIVDFYTINPDKISIVYQGCHQQYYEKISDSYKHEIRKKYNLPENYLLNVGTIEERKNSFSIIKALHKFNIDKHLVLVGRQTPYNLEILNYINKHNLQKQITIINNADFKDLPAIYQSSDLFIYPSFFEGFGIPIIEALVSEIPVITTQGGCFGEAGGNAAKYVNPSDIESIADAIFQIANNNQLRTTMIENGKKHVERFSEKAIAENLFSTYKSLL